LSAVAPARRRWHWRGPLIFLLVVVILLVVVDRVAVVVAEHRVADKVKSSQDLASTPSVSIEGFPFLTQVIGNHYRDVRVNAKDLTVGASSDRLKVSQLTARLGGVRATGHFSGVTATTVNGTASVGYAELSRVVGVSLGYAGIGTDGRGRVSAMKSASALGKTITGTVSAEVNIVGGSLLTFSAIKVGISDVGLQLPQSVTDQFAAIFAKQLSLSGLPFGLQVQSITVAKSGVSITAIGHNVALG
jgi:DUF2993 family protein